jgi:hypothetical protein
MVSIIALTLITKDDDKGCPWVDLKVIVLAAIL